MDRLSRTLDWRLLAPEGECLPGQPGFCFHEERERLLQSMQQNRAETFAAVGQVIPPTRPEYPWSDWNAWHVLATRKSDGEVVGGVRLFVIPCAGQSVRMRDLLIPCGVRFADPEVEREYSRAFDALLESHASETHLIYVGPLFVTEPHKRSGLAAILGLAGNAVFRILNCRLGLTMATTRDRAAELFLRLGSHRLATEAGSLMPFRCAQHREDLEMLATDPLCVERELEANVDSLVEELSGTAVTTGRFAHS